MFSPEQLKKLRVCVELKIAQVKRAQNAAPELEFKELYKRQLVEYSALLIQIDAGVENAEKEKNVKA